MQALPKEVHSAKLSLHSVVSGIDRAVPRHLGIVLHGHQRWLEQHAFPDGCGFTRATAELVGIVDRCVSLQIEQLTLYLFTDDIPFALTLTQGPDETGFFRHVRHRLKTLLSQGVRLRIQGDLNALPLPMARMFLAAQEHSARHQGMTLNLSINGCQTPTAISKTPASQPVLVIRTGGLLPMDHGLVWDTAETALYRDHTPWPAFDLHDFDAALGWFMRQDRLVPFQVADSPTTFTQRTDLTRYHMDSAQH